MEDPSLLYKKHLINLYAKLKDFTSRHSELSASHVIDNPHTERLLQAFSLLHSDLYCTLEESFTQFIGVLFDALYPHYNIPIPSFAILECAPDPKKEEVVTLNKNALLEVESGDNSYNFEVCYKSQIVPLHILSASCGTSANISSMKDNQSTLCIKLKTHGKGVFAKIALKSLRFYINGLDEIKYSIYQNLFQSAVGIALYNGQDLMFLKSACLKKVGFEEDDNLLPQHQSSFTGYRVLTEFFAFPEKFLFFDIDLSDCDLNRFGSTLEIRFYLKTKELNGLVATENFVLNATPVVNLSKAELDPVMIEPEIFEYLLSSPDERSEIYSVDQVVVNFGDGEETVAAPLLEVALGSKDSRSVWYSIRRQNVFENGSYRKSNLYLSLFQDKRILLNQSIKYFYAKVKCFNGNFLYEEFAKVDKRFAFMDNTIPIAGVKCIKKPTSVYHLCTTEDQKWNMIAHISPHYMNLLSTVNGQNVLKKLIELYSSSNKVKSDTLINALRDITVKERVMRIKTAKYNQFSKGSAIEITVDHSNVLQGFLYLFLSIVEDFLGVYCSVNTFIQITGKLATSNTLIYQGVARNGKRCFI